MDRESPLSRRRLLQSGVAAGTLLLAGCGSDGGSRTASPARTTQRSPEPTAASAGTDSGIETASTRPTVPLGEAVADDTVAMVLQGASKRSEIGGRTASSGNEFVVAFLAVKNRTDDTFVSTDDLDTFRLATGDGSYSRVPVPTEPGSQFRGGLIAPGEVIRGYLVFEAPPDISSPAVELDVESEAIDIERVTFRLDARADAVVSFEQTLRVPVASVGESVTDGGMTVSVTDFRTTDAIGNVESGQGATFAVPKLRFENNTDERKVIVVAGQALVKNGVGDVYASSIDAHAELDDTLKWNQDLQAGSAVEGEVPYTVDADATPLHFVFDLSGLVDGRRYFWTLQ